MTGIYTRIWTALVALTFVEVGLAWVRTPPVAMVVLLLVLSLGKAGLIAWYFMHLRTHRPRGWAAMIPALFLFVGMLLLLLPDGVRSLSMRAL